MILNLQNIFTKASNIVIRDGCMQQGIPRSDIYSLIKAYFKRSVKYRLVQTDAKKLSFEGLVVF